MNDREALCCSCKWSVPAVRNGVTLYTQMCHINSDKRLHYNHCLGTCSKYVQVRDRHKYPIDCAKQRGISDEDNLLVKYVPKKGLLARLKEVLCRRD